MKITAYPTRRALQIVQRYGLQDLAAGAGALLSAYCAMRGGCGEAARAILFLIAEYAIFYGIAFARAWSGSARAVVVGLLQEYGRAELLDLLVRPALILLGATWMPDSVLGLGVGSLAADIVFYAGAASAYAREGCA